ncbi:MAG TPA: hypothetical protein VGP93_16520 [Polyangiaceae bacterium]|nr:hypothetical protein [Polyangiaceae bacterium]
MKSESGEELVSRPSADDVFRDALRGALSDEGPSPDVLRGFQQKLRERSGGKFYADGWSTARHAPTNTYLITALLMLAAIGLIYALMRPLSGDPERVENISAPVNVVAPAPQ